MENNIISHFENAIGGSGIGENDYPGTTEIVCKFLGICTEDVQFNVHAGEVSIGDAGGPYRIDTVTFPSLGFSAQLILSYCVQWEWSVLDVSNVTDTVQTDYLTASSFASLLNQAMPDASVRINLGGEDYSLSADRIEESGDGCVITIHA